MNDHTLMSALVLASAMGLLGLIFGLAYFRALRRAIALVTANRGWLRPAGFTLARIAGALIVLTVMARLGAMSLLGGFLGLLVARQIALHSARRAG